MSDCRFCEYGECPDHETTEQKLKHHLERWEEDQDDRHFMYPECHDAPTEVDKFREAISFLCKEIDALKAEPSDKH